MSSPSKLTLSGVSRQRLLDAIAVHEAILKRHPASSETHRYSKASIELLRAELARRDRRRQPNRTRTKPKRRGRKNRAAREASSSASIRARGKVTTTTTQSKSVKRVQNPRVVLVASKGARTLRYVGRGKFTSSGRGVRFRNSAEVRAVARVLRSEYPGPLRGYRLGPK